MKTFMNKASFAAMALVIGASALASGANAQDNRYDDHNHNGRTVEHVNVVVRQPVVVERPVVVRQPVVMQPVRRGGLFDRLDINNDGAVSKWEFSQRYGNSRMAMRTFYRADANHTGKLTPQEVAANRAMIKELPRRA